MDLTDLYQEVILDHSKRPRNLRPLPQATHNAEGYNPLCGDHVKVHLVVEDGIIQDAAFEGCGCAISTASASLMTDIVKGKSITEVEELVQNFRDVLMNNKEHEIGDLEVLCGVKNFPMRVKCATLVWHAVVSAIHQTGVAVTE